MLRGARRPHLIRRRALVTAAPGAGGPGARAGCTDARGSAPRQVLGRAGLEPRFLLAKGALVLAAGPVAGARRDCVDTDMFEGAA